MSALLVLFSATAYTLYRRLEGNISSEDVEGRLGDRPDKITGALNILLIGSDSRAGDNAEYGTTKGARSDTTLLLHISEDHKHASLVSFPRDTIVDLPSCEREDGTTTATEPKNLAGSRPRFNWAYANGGSACTIKLVEQMTDVRIDHHVVLDFEGFKRVVDALGGVEMCIPEPIDDRQAHLELSAGEQTLNGDEALGYMRARKTVGNGSDLSRINRQQDFLAAAMRQVKDTNLLTDWKSLLDVLDAATKSITTDPGLDSIDEMKSYADSMKDVDPKDVEMITVPVVDNPEELKHATVVLKEPDAQVLFDKLKADEPLKETKKKKPTPGPTATPKPTSTEPPLKTQPQNVNVRVLNGSGISGAAAKAAEDLKAVGFNVVEVGNADRADYTETVVRHDGVYDESARTLAKSVGGAPTEVDNTLSTSVVLIVGKDYQGAKEVTVAGSTPTPKPTLQARSADEKKSEGVCG